MAAPSARAHPCSGPARPWWRHWQSWASEEALSPHPGGQESPSPRAELHPTAQRGHGCPQGPSAPPGHRGSWGCPRCSPRTQTTSPSRRHAVASPASGTLRGGSAGSPLAPHPPRRWREAVGRAGERTLTETLFSHPKNSSWPFPQLPGLANALPLDEKKKEKAQPPSVGKRAAACVERGTRTPQIETGDRGERAGAEEGARPSIPSYSRDVLISTRSDFEALLMHGATYDL